MIAVIFEAEPAEGSLDEHPSVVALPWPVETPPPRL